MNKEEQLVFIKELSENVIKDIILDIEADKTPDTWNGLELRRLLAYRFAEVVIGEMPKKRLQAFRNTLVTNNL